jgi:iron(III) transport system ATP-binding protein
VLVLQNVSRSFGAVAALRDVSLEIASGQLVCLVGHSGCGKSTLLRTIAGIETIDAGRILIDGGQVAGDGVFVEPEHRRVGFMFQDYALFPHLSVRQNIGFGLASMPRPLRHQRVEEIIARIGIGALADRYPHMLSGGEQQRVALARALAPQPSVLLMDEPFSNLDRGLRDRVRDETLSLVRHLGMTAVVVTHDPEEALAIGDMVVLMQDGRVVEAGTGEAIYARPATAYAASFFSRMNQIPARQTEAGVDTPFGRLPSTLKSGAAPKALLRPTSIHIADRGVPAQVVNRTLLGELEELTLVVEGLPEPLLMRSTRRHAVLPGQTVHLSVNADEIMIFQDDAQQPSAPDSRRQASTL